MGKLALAMQEAHARGVIHRDLKPRNIMIKTSGRHREPVIVDFGLARRNDAQDGRADPGRPGPGHAGLHGPGAGPRRPAGGRAGLRHLRLGVILYELLTGQLPFAGTGLAVVGQILTQPPLPPSTLRPDLDPRLEAICLKAMAKEVAGRYASMAELAAALTDYLRSAAPRPAPRPPRVRRRPLGPRVAEPRSAGSSTLVDQFFEQVAAEQARDPRPRTRSRWPLLPLLRPASGGRGSAVADDRRGGPVGVLLLGVIIYVATDKGRIKIVVDDPEDRRPGRRREVRIEELGEPITLRAGEHALTIRQGGDRDRIPHVHRPSRRQRDLARRVRTGERRPRRPKDGRRLRPRRWPDDADVHAPTPPGRSSTRSG